MRGRISLFVILVIWLPALPALAQVESRNNSGSQAASPDSIQVTRDTATVDSANISQSREKKHSGKSVRTAMILSALIPGGGQFYNESYWKGGLVAAAEFTLASFTIREHLLMMDVERMWSRDVPDSIKGPKIDSLEGVYRDRRNVWAFFTGVVAAFAVADAYVDANMYHFTEQQRLTIGPADEGLGLALRYRF